MLRTKTSTEDNHHYGATPQVIEKCNDCPDNCPTKVTRLRISNLCCAGEERIIRNVFTTMDGIQKYSISILGKYAIITHCSHDCCQSTAPTIRDKLNEMQLGAYLQEVNDGSNSEEEDETETREFYIKVAFACLLASLFLVGLLCDFLDIDITDGIPTDIYEACIGIGAIPIVYDVYIAFIRRTIDINVLMLMAVIGALSIQEYLDAALVVTLFTIASLVEDGVLRWVRGIVNISSGGIPTDCTLADGQVVKVDSLKIGDVVVYRAGDMISMDGIVTKGEGVVDEAALTGEAKPITKEVGSQAHSGTIMQDGYIEIEVKELPENTTIRKLQQTIAEVQADRGEVMTLVDEFAAYWTPTVLFSAILVFLIAFACTGDWSTWLYRSLSILVLACPCSIIVSAPIPCLIGIASAARKGVIIKGSSVVEAAGEIDTIGLDKTGTLTKGNFEVSELEEIKSHDGDTSIEPLQLAASLESKSSHPLAAAVVSSYTGCIADSLLNDSLCSVQDIKIVPGVGISGWVASDSDESDWLFCVIGNEKVFSTVIGGSQCRPNAQALEQYKFFSEKHSKQGASILVVSIDDQLRLLVALSDSIRPEAAEMCHTLAKKDIAVTILTGDHPVIAHDVASKIGVHPDNVKARLLPTEKLDWVQNANARGKKVMMLGDGINDAAALSASHLGVAMGAGCSAMASMAAKIVVMSNNLLRVSSVMELCTWIRSVIYINIFVSVISKICAMIFAVTGNLLLWEAVLIDIFSLLFVVGLSCTVISFEWREPGEDDQTQLNVDNTSSSSNSYCYTNIPNNDDAHEIYVQESKPDYSFIVSNDDNQQQQSNSAEKSIELGSQV